MLRRPIAAVLATLLGILATPARGEDSGSDRGKALRDAFRPMRLTPAAKLEKDLVPVLPAGIVTEAKPFDELIVRFGKPALEQLARREAALSAHDGPMSVADAEALKAAWKTVEAEGDDLGARVAAVEARYGEVYNLAWGASGDREKQTRKLAAVLIPLYRGLLVAEARVAARAGEALGGTKGPGLAWLVAASADPSPGFRAIVVDALGRVGGPEALATLQRLATSDPESPVRLRALAALAAWKVSATRLALIAALGDPAWEVRALGVRMCARARLVEATEALIRALEKEDGRLRRDEDDALFALVGVRMDGDAALWRKWWGEHAAEVEARAKALAAEGAYDKPLGPAEAWDVADGADPASKEGAEGRATTAAFYGIVTTSKRVVFVVDVSKSMEEAAKERPPSLSGKAPYGEPAGRAKLDIAKWQLHRAIAALPPDATFDVIVFSESYHAWQPTMTEATPKAKAKAHEFVDAIVANGTTNISDSLDRAFELAGATPLLLRGKAPRTSLAADTVYLLTDGDPNRGRVTDLAALLEDVALRARSARLVVHAIGIGEVSGSSFLGSLAKRTGGQYVGFP